MKNVTKRTINLVFFIFFLNSKKERVIHVITQAKKVKKEKNKTKTEIKIKKKKKRKRKRMTGSSSTILIGL